MFAFTILHLQFHSHGKDDSHKYQTGVGLTIRALKQRHEILSKVYPTSQKVKFKVVLRTRLSKQRQSLHYA